MKRCDAKTRGGGTCRNFPVQGRDRCRMHGGKQKRGVAHHRFKNGFFSKYVSADLQSVLAELEGIDNEELINSSDEIKLMQALISQSDALKSGVNDLKDLESITRIIDRLVFSKQRTQQILLQERQLIPATDVKAFLDYVETVLTDFVPEHAVLIINKIKTFKLS